MEPKEFDRVFSAEFTDESVGQTTLSLSVVKDNLIRMLGGDPTVNAETCIFCKSTNLKFRDELSASEFKITRQCQDCQDAMFNEEDPFAVHDEQEEIIFIEPTNLDEIEF